jgi:hypothetical protein
VTRARRARRARLRASRPVAARAASRTRFGASSRSVLHAFCFFTRFVFSRVLFFHRVWVVTLSFVRQNFKKKRRTGRSRNRGLKLCNQLRELL